MTPAALALALWCSVAAPQNGASPVEHIVGDLAASPSLEANLRVLCDEIGGRLPGTPAMKRAVGWAMEAFERVGLERVHTESFTIPTSWAEGETRAEVIEPVRFHLHIAALGWSPPTPNGGLEAEVLAGGRGEEGDITRLGAQVRGKVLLIRSDLVSSFQDMSVEQKRSTIALREAAKEGAAAVLLTSTRPRGLLYRHTNVLDGRLDKIPAAVVAREDAQRILRTLEAGRPVRMRLDMPNKTGGAFQADNVVAEIRGGQKPEEVVILGAHLDSWDLGTGCLDNGCNAALVVEVARSIQAGLAQRGELPRRTIHFILFGGEEEGLLGSRAYVEQHRSELDRIVAVVVHDIGVGKISGYSLGGRRDTEPALSKALAPVAARGVNAHTADAFFGTDHFDFLLEGIPTFVANQDTTDYVPNYHAQSDTFDKVDLTELKNQAGIAAAVVYGLAEQVERPGKRLSRKEVEAALKETGLDEQLRFLGLWDGWKRGERGRRQ
ncbi:MAG: M28 family peptidase [Acidobacteria bacterium]|nr:M28 family peptidase [Acidobacteriota bacterium]